MNGLPGAARRLHFEKMRRWVLTTCLVVCGIVTSAVLAYLSHYRDVRNRREDFQHLARDHVWTTRSLLKTPLVSVEALAAFFNAYSEVTREDFHDFAQSLLKNYPGLRALVWIRSIPNVQRQLHEKTGQQLFGETFQFSQRNAEGKLVPAPEREEYFPVFFVEPYSGNEAMPGFDISSDPKRRKALERARDTGKPVATGCVKLLQQDGQDTFGILILMPVYRRGAILDNVAQRRANLIGFVGAVFRVESLLATVMDHRLPSTLVQITVRDNSTPANPLLLCQMKATGNNKYKSSDTIDQPVLAYEEEIPIAGRKWLIQCQATKGYFQKANGWLPWGILGGGLLLTGLLLILLISVFRHSDRQRRLTNELLATNADLAKEITEHAQAEDSLRETEARYRGVFDATTDGLIIFDNEGTVADANLAACDMHGYGRKEFIGLKPKDILHPDYLPLFAESERQLHEGKTFSAESIHLRKDGTTFTIDVQTVALTIKGEFHQLAVMRDITEQKKMEERLVQSQKMEAVGQLAGGVAHDYRNQLTVIRGYGEMLMRRDTMDEEAREYVEEILHAVDRSAALSNELLTFSRKQILSPEIVNLNDLVEGMGKSLSRMIGEDISLSFELGAGDEFSVKIDPMHFQQALINLVVNARDAMPHGGRLTIETAQVTMDEEFLRAHHGAVAGPYVMVAVSDTGGGMAKDTLGRAFEPFFTTKERGQGTGLGLSMVYGFVKQTGGYITLYSELSCGTTVKIYLPKANQQASTIQGKKQTVGTLAGGREKILIVEDEDPIRQVLVTTLSECGYTVMEADGPKEALAIAREHPLAIDLLITDVVMPQMNGVELAERIRAFRPNIEVLYISGYTGKALARHGIVHEDVALLTKPFSSHTLTMTVRRLLDQREQQNGGKT